MSACAECGSVSPEGSTHCVHCGAALPAPGAEGPANTSHFGDQDVKNLVARIASEERAETGDGNLLAGLPRPKAASMVSPLRGGQTTASARQPAPEKRRARSAAGSTVMGMPLYSTGEQGVIRPTARRSAASTTPPVDELAASGASIQSLDDFQGDMEAAQASTPPAAVAAEPGAGAGAELPSVELPGVELPSADQPGADTPSQKPEASPSPGIAEPAPSHPAAPAMADAAPAGPASPAPSTDAARTSTGPLDLSQPASSSKAGLIAALVVLTVVAAAVAFFALK